MNKKKLTRLFQKHPNWPRVHSILNTLKNAGHTAYIAGGAVRDGLLGKIPKDFDVATSARPGQVLTLFPKGNRHGKSFGVVGIKAPVGHIEVATFRQDGPYLDGRRPQYVKFLSPKEDALRRDFTVNALFYDAFTSRVIDFTGGISDLKKQMLRTVGDPYTRFDEDRLRVLRGFRLKVQLQFKLAVQTKKAMLDSLKKLNNLSKDRVHDELIKMIDNRDTLLVGQVLYDTGIIKELLMGTKIPITFCKKFWTETGQSRFKNDKIKEAATPPHRTTHVKAFLWSKILFPVLIKKQNLFFTSQGKWNPLFKKHLKEWRFPLQVIKQLNEMTYSSYELLFIEQHFQRPLSMVEKLHIVNSSLWSEIRFLTKIHLKLQGQNDKALRTIEKEFKTRAKDGRLPPPKVTGHDLKSLGFKEGFEMAKTLKLIYNLQIENNIQSKTKLLKMYFRDK